MAVCSLYRLADSQNLGCRKGRIEKKERRLTCLPACLPASYCIVISVLERDLLLLLLQVQEVCSTDLLLPKEIDHGRVAALTAMSVSPNTGNLVATGFGNGTLAIFDVREPARAVRTCHLPAGFSSHCGIVDLAPWPRTDLENIVAGSASGRLSWVDLRATKNVRTTLSILNGI